MAAMGFSSTDVLELPDNISATYLSEGAANIVYTITVPPQGNVDGQGDDYLNHKTVTPSPWHGKLLRFRKDLPTTTPTLIAHTAFRQSIAPLFPPEDLIDIRLVSLASTSIIYRLNAALRAAELPSDPSKPSFPPRRPLRRHGVYLAEDSHALLITDMSPPPSSTLIQFKPKWLAPSPSTPPSTKRCRTCALHAQRGLKSCRFCPLDLMSPSPTDVRRASAALLGLPFPPPPPDDTTAHQQLAQLDRVARWAQGSPLLRRLRDLQVSHDPVGVLEVLRCGGGGREMEGLQVAMTLRDVTVFLVVPADGGADVNGKGGGGWGEMRARLGDLDVKSLGKVGEWVQVERGLREGWYQGVKGEVVDCLLGRVVGGGEDDDEDEDDE